jgi:uncharacterized membrane protein YhdT
MLQSELNCHYPLLYPVVTSSVHSKIILLVFLHQDMMYTNYTYTYHSQCYTDTYHFLHPWTPVSYITWQFHILMKHTHTHTHMWCVCTISTSWRRHCSGLGSENELFHTLSPLNFIVYVSVTVLLLFCDINRMSEELQSIFRKQCQWREQNDT